MNEGKYLPLGTIVLLKNASKRIMIIGFEASVDAEATQNYDYIGCLYPEGVISPDKNLLFNHNQIEKIIVNGFSDEEDVLFKQKLVEVVKQRNQKELITNNSLIDMPIIKNEAPLEVFDIE